VDQIEIYKGYNIRVFESSPGKWTAEIPKVDGSLIQILRPGLEDDAQDCLTTDPETMNAEAAILLAKEAIDQDGWAKRKAAEFGGLRSLSWRV
jgi:hypothetical protein